MRLSQIKIAGFKSFVDPTKILFPASVTGIVGPNGCGKSNVIDAVRWVMGESSAKNLRGESMEDVIFSGSSGRKPVGQASVELIFDNTDGRITGEYAKYTEISIKRIATRAGQSKYFLNNTRCRRRDIADIFLGTGLGPRSYSIIEQGMVSRIIDAKPEDLRVYLEEAAGISKYKERRRETETRIRHTRENLERLIDLIEEIEKQLARLDRQSKTAEKYKQLKAEQRQLEAECLLLEKRAFDAEEATHRQAMTSNETALEGQMAQLRETERLAEETRQQQVEATDKHNTIQGHYYRLGSDIANREQAIEHEKNLRQRNQQELDGLQQSLSESRSILEEDRHRLQQLQQELDQVTPDLQTADQSLQQLEVNLGSIEEAVHQWQEQWDIFRREYHQAHESAQIENRGIEHIERQVQNATQRRQRFEEELTALDDSEAVTQIKTLETGIEETLKQHAATMEEADQRAMQIQQLRSDLASQASELDERRTRVQSLRGRLSSLEALQQHVLAEENQVVQQWLSNNRIDSKRRLTNLIKVADGFERAVEAVLSPFLAAYCVTQGMAIPSQLLPEQHLALFDSGASTAIDSSPRWQSLADYVQCEVSLTSLLNKVFVCESTDQLMQRRQQLQAGESLVTREGLWAGPNWVLQLGKDDEQSGVLARENEIKAIKQEETSITQSAMELKSRHDGDRLRLQELEQSWDQDQRRLSELQNQLSEQRQQLSRHQGRINQVQERRLQLEKDLQELDQLNEKYNQELQTNSSRRNEFLQHIESMSEREQHLQQQKTDKQQALSESRQAVQDARGRFHELQLKQQRLQSEKQATESNIARISDQNQQYESRIHELRDKVENAHQPIGELEQSLQKLLQERASNEQEMNASQKVLTEIDHRLRALDNDRNKQQQAVDEARSALEAIRLKLQESQIRGKTIVEQLQKTGVDVQALAEALSEQADLSEWNRNLDIMNTRIERLGPINLAAIDEYQEQLERKQYLDEQHADLISALDTLESAIRKIDKETRDRFKETFDQVNTRIGQRFPKLFGGGEAYLELTENDLLNTGVLIMARPPGKRVTNLQLLSGGEKALTAVALIFAIFELNPSPFCMLDEVDAPLDDANVGRFGAMVAEMSKQVQFIMITHNKITMEIAENLNGVTMHEPGVSRLVSVDVGEAVELAGV